MSINFANVLLYPRDMLKNIILLTLVAIVIGHSRIQDETSNQVCPPNSQTNNVQGSYEIINDCVEENDDSNGLRRVLFTNNITCNDGSAAGFYVRKSGNSKKWIVYLEGGWFCYNEENCRERWSRDRYLMSSEHWTPFRSGSGILSNNADENPYWWHANHVFVPYCTSDLWSGKRVESSKGGGFSFMGALVVKHVVKELLRIGLKKANSMILAGSSAGGVGVMLNLEPVQRLLTRYGTNVKLYGITDSGWFLDQPPFTLDSAIVTPVQAVKQGIPIWRSQIPHTCRMAYPAEQWKCFIGYRIYPTLSAPLFVFQWLFDEAQMEAENVGTPVTKQQWEYIHTMGEILRNSFHNVTSVFAPSCISHSILSKKDWYYIRVDDVSLPEALHCWERQMRAKFPKISTKRLNVPHVSNNSTGKINEIVESASLTFPAKQRKKRRRSKQRKHFNKHHRKNLLKNSSLTTCSFRLIERCSWPQCNHYCPKLQNPLTGKKLDLLELLKSFGMDMTNVATELGVDIHTLNNMGQKELINLLTQQV